MNTTHKLALGTVQFGLNYGIANQSGQLGMTEIEEILATFRASGGQVLDTAIGYGDSEARLGLMKVTDLKVVSKLPPIGESAVDLKKVVLDAARGSLERLGIDQLHALLVHHPSDLTGVHGAVLHAALLDAKEQGLTRKIGISIYTPEILEEVTGNFAIDLVQAPFNLVDRRLVTSGWLHRLKSQDIEVHTRSAFLQGLLLMPPLLRPQRFKKWDMLWRAFDGFLKEEKISALQATLGFVKAHPEIDQVIVGVDNAAHLREIQAAWACDVPDAPDILSCTDIDLIDPSNWSQN